MKALHMPGSLFLLLLVTACVTINVYFPAEAAVKAADRIILDVYGEAKEDKKAPAQEPQSIRPQPGIPAQIGMQMLDWLIAPAHAEADIISQYTRHSPAAGIDGAASSTACGALRFGRGRHDR